MKMTKYPGELHPWLQQKYNAAVEAALPLTFIRFNDTSMEWLKDAGILSEAKPRQSLPRFSRPLMMGQSDPHCGLFWTEDEVAAFAAVNGYPFVVYERSWDNRVETMWSFKNLVCNLMIQTSSEVNGPLEVKKLKKEEKALQQKMKDGDLLGALLEAADVAYYTGKLLLAEYVDEEEALTKLEELEELFLLPPGKIYNVLEAKYTTRFALRGKDDRKERLAVLQAL